MKLGAASLGVSAVFVLDREVTLGATLEVVKPSLLAEIRDWIAFGLTGIFGYLTWRWRPRRDNTGSPRDHFVHLADSVKVSDAVDLKLSPVTLTTDARLSLATGEDAGTLAALDSWAEVSPYEFPPN